MAIEDAATLADCIVPGDSSGESDLSGCLQRWERLRKPRVTKVARRGALNHLAWHAAGPVALARNFLLRHRSPQKLAADLDWLYGD
jgi:salicylate hydroxylase